jgi:hypothetical protein
MAVVNGYCTVAQLKARFDLDGPDNDPLITNAVNAASRQVDQHCHRRFYVDTTVAARVFQATSPYLVEVDDFSTTTGLIVKTDSGDNGTYDVTWDAADYQVEPLNAVAGGIEGHAYTRVRAVSTRRFYLGRRPRVQITAKWGWAAVPPPVADATMIQAARLFRRKDTPDGIAGGFEFGAVRVSSRFDPDVEMLLAPFCRVVA